MHSHDRQMCDPLEVASEVSFIPIMKLFEMFVDTMQKIIEQTFSKYGPIKGALFSTMVAIFLKIFFPELLTALLGFFRWPRGQAVSSSATIGEAPAATVPQAPSVNIHVNLDSSTLGGYVQQIREDRSRTSPCATPAPNSPVTGIENIGDGPKTNSREFAEKDTVEKDEKEKEEKKLT